MKLRCAPTILAIALCLAILCMLAGCLPTPDKAQVEVAIRDSLSQEVSPPEIDFSTMTVPTSYSGKSMVVVKSADGFIVRGYLIGYDRQTHSFTAKLDYSRRLDLKAMSYKESGEQGSSEISYYFDFSETPDAEYTMFYAGEGDSLDALRAAFEENQLDGFPNTVNVQFEVCDFGGDTLMLLVPRYEGLKVWISRIDHQGDTMFSGDEVAHFENGMPVYIYCSFSDKLPAYEIHFSLDGNEHFLTTNEKLLESVKQENQEPEALMTRQLK